VRNVAISLREMKASSFFKTKRLILSRSERATLRKRSLKNVRHNDVESSTSNACGFAVFLLLPMNPFTIPRVSVFSARRSG
jgi:hypothetical protein